MQDNKEHFLDSKTLVAIIFLAFSWLAWDYYMKKKYPPKPDKAVGTLQSSQKQAKREKIQDDHQEQAFPSNLQNKYKEKTFEFKGKNMEIVFSSKGLGIKTLKLNKHYNRQKNPVSFNPHDKPLFSSHFFKDTGKFIPFKIRREGKLFIGTFSSSLFEIKKIVKVQDEKFALKVKTEIKPLSGAEGLSLFFSHPLPQQGKQGFFKMLFFYGADVLKSFVLYEGDKTKRPIEEDFEQKLSFINVQFVGLGGKYFGKAFINSSNLLPSLKFSKNDKEAFAQIDYKFLHSRNQSLEYDLFLGPKALKDLSFLGDEAKLWLDFGFFSWLSRPILLFLIELYKLCHNWGLAIILLTFVIRLILLPINIKSYKSMKVMQKIQPQIKELKEIHKKDPRKLNQETMALMKKHKANPLGGCLPMFLQLPIFFALYRVLGESIELYQSPFVFWIKDLSLKDPLYIFPVLGGLVLFVQQKITPMSLPKEQARIIMFMPLIFSVFMLNLPSGLTLYIFFSSLFALFQQFFFVKIGSSYLQGGEDVKTV